MCEYTWWYLYVHILNEEAQRKLEINKLVESILPWVNPEMWAEYQKQKDKGRENIAYEDQLRAMLQGKFSTDPNTFSMPDVDQFEVSDAAKQRVTPQQGDTTSQMFEQGGSMRDQLFPGQRPTFRGDPGNIPPEFKDFYKDLPDVTDFPPEKPPEEE